MGWKRELESDKKWLIPKELAISKNREVESRGVEPLSKHRHHWLSTCLFHY